MTADRKATVAQEASAPITKDDYTNRYVAAAVRTVPAAQRDDYADELRSSIYDQIDARVEAGESGAEAEQAVLTELGDPGRLAAEYAGRQLHLIGPGVFLIWKRVLTITLWSTLPFVATGVAIWQGLERPLSFGIIGPVVGITLSAGVHLAFWVTLAFAIGERARATAPDVWTPDLLPLREETRVTVTEIVVMSAMFALFVAAIVWDGTIGFVPWSENAGEPLSLLDPEIWPWSAVGAATLLLATTLLNVWANIAKSWTMPMAIVNAAIAVVAASAIATLIGNDLLFNPAMVEFTGIDSDAERAIGIVVAVATVGIASWIAVDGIVRARRGIGARR